MKRNGNREFICIAMILGVIACFAANSFAAELIVSWDPNQETDLAGYKVHYGTSSRQYSTTIDVGDTTQYTATNLTEGIEYFIAVSAYDKKNNESSYSEEVSTVIPVRDTTAPGAPTITSGQVNGLKITVGWTQNTEPDFVGYKVYYGTTSGSYSQTIQVGNSQFFTTPNLTEGVIYFFAVSALDTANNESNLSNELNIYIPIKDIVAPGSPVVLSYQVQQSRVSLSWQNNPESDLAGYTLHYGKSSGSYSNTINLGKVSSYQTPELDQGDTYFFALTAFDTAGNVSGYSTEFSVTIPIIDTNAPDPPIVLSYYAQQSRVSLSWQNNPEPDLVGYTLHYGKSSGFYNNTINMGKVSSYQTPELDQGDTYFFALTAFDTAGNVSGYSTEFNVTMPIIDTSPPGVPVVLSYNVQDSKVNMSWQDNPEPDLAGYTLHYGKSSGSYENNVNLGLVNSFQTPELDQGDTYFFTLSAYDTAGNKSGYFTEFSVTIPVIDTFPPGAPVVSSYNVQDSKVNIAWQNNPEPDLAGYVVHYGKSSESYVDVINVGSITAFQTPVLDQGFTYFFALTAYDTANNVSAYSNEFSIGIPIIDTTPPGAPVVVSSQAQDSKVNLAWQNNPEPDLSGYVVHYGKSTGSYTSVMNVGKVVAYQTPLLDEGDTYFFAVTAYDTANNASGYSSEVSVTIPIIDVTPPQAPAITSADVKDSRVSLEWHANSELDLVGYTVYYGQASGRYSETINIGNLTQYTTPQLEQGLTYFFVVSAYDTSNNQSTFSAEVSVRIPIIDNTPPITPREISYQRIDNKVNIDWRANTETDLVGYRVYYGNASQNYNKTIEVGVTTSYITPELSSGLMYFFAMSAYDTAGNESAYSTEFSIAIPIPDTTPPLAPEILTYQRQGDGVNLIWTRNDESDLSGYKVFNGTQSGNYSDSTTLGAVNNFTTPALETGKTYYFVVAAYDTANNMSSYSNEISIYLRVPDTAPPQTPIISNYERQGNKVFLSWSANSAADLSGYTLKYGKISGLYDVAVSVGTATSYTTPELEQGFTYYFSLSAIDTSGNESNPSAEVGVVIPLPDLDPPAPPVIASYNLQEDRVEVQWQQNLEPDLAAYVFHYGQSTGQYTQNINVGMTTSYTTPPLVPGNRYYFALTAVDTASNVSSYSTEISITISVVDTTSPNAPEILSWERQGDRVALAWAESIEPDVMGYRVYYGKKSGYYTESADVGQMLTYTSKILEDGYTYFFSLTAYDTVTNESQHSAEIAVTIPPKDETSPVPPTIASYGRQGNRLQAEWNQNSEDDVAGYKFHYGKNSHAYDNIIDLSLATSYLSPELEQGNIYYFALTAYDTAGNESSYSIENMISIPTPDETSPEAPIVTSYSRQGDSVALSWQANTEPDLAAYRVHYGVTSQTYVNTESIGLSTNYTTPALEQGRTYYFALTAIDTANNVSDYSTELSIYIPEPDVVPPSAPVISLYERLGDKVQITWESSQQTDLAGFRCYYGTQSGVYDNSKDAGKATSYTTPDLDQGNTYFFVVSAYDTAGNESNVSNEVSVLIPAPDKAAPSAPVILTYERQGNKVFIVWEKNTEADLIGYRLLYGTQSGNYDVSASIGLEANYTTPDLSQGHNYYFVVTALDTAGNISNYSTEVSVHIPAPDTTPPAIPMITTYALQGTSRVQLSWQANTEPDFYQYRLYYGLFSRNYTDSVTVSSSTSYTTPELLTDANYFFALAASDTSGNWSNLSTEVSVTIPKIDPVDNLAPAAPVITNHSVEDARLFVNWQANSEQDLAGYYFHYGQTTGQYTQHINVGNTANYMTPTLEQGATYYFAVTAYDLSQNVSVHSVEISVTVPADTTTPPPSPVLTKVEVDERKVHLFWNPVIADDLVGYKIYYGTESGNYTVVQDVNNVTDYITSDLVDNMVYYFVITAYDTYNNESNFSNELIADLPLIDITPPIVYALEIDNANLIHLVYSEAVEKKSAENMSNYSISNNISILGITLDSNQRMVNIATSAHQKGAYTLSVSNVTDLAKNPNPIRQGSTISYEYDPGDIVPPELLVVEVVDAAHLNIYFSEEIERTSAETVQNYQISKGVTVISALLDANSTMVHLTTTEHQDDVQYTITVNNVYDRAPSPNTIPKNSRKSYLYNEADTTPPGIYSVEVVSQTQLRVIFTETVDQASAEKVVNYTIHDNVNVISAVLQNDMKAVLLNTSVHTAGIDYMLEVSNILDLGFPPNVISEGSQYPYKYVPIDIFAPEIDTVIAIDANLVEITFNEAVETSSAETVSNYMINGEIQIISAQLTASQRVVQLSTSAHEGGSDYILFVSNIRDRAAVPNVIRSNTEFEYRYTAVDVTPPKIGKVIARESNEIDVFFSEIVDRITAEDVANYSINNGIKITQATLYEDLKTVLLETSNHAANEKYELTVNNIKDRAAIANVIAPNTKVSYDYQPASHMLAGNVSDPDLEFAYLVEGDGYYVDRSYKIKEIPSDLQNLLWLKTPNDDRDFVEVPYVSFDLYKRATIYVAYDAKAYSPPSWLKDHYTMTSYVIEVSGYSQSFNIWEKEFEPGVIVLGANMAQGAYGAESMFFVLMREDAEGTQGESPAGTDPLVGGNTFALFQNYPNPFNAGTEIRYQLPENCYVSLTIYNILGQTIQHLVRGEKQASHYVIHWDGRNSEGNLLPSGVYFLRLEVIRNTTINGRRTNQVVYDNVRKMIFLK